VVNFLVFASIVNGQPEKREKVACRIVDGRKALPIRCLFLPVRTADRKR
jgi:hypothetical protein